MKLFKKQLFQRFIILILVSAILSTINIPFVKADYENIGKVLDINFTYANSVKGKVADSALSDFYVGKATFDLGVGNVEGTIGFDFNEGAVYAKSSASETVACGARFYIYSKNSNRINGSDYRYMKVRFKSEIPITDSTTVALRDAATHWAYYGVAYNAVGNSGWTEVVIDLMASHTLGPVGDWSQASIGVGDTFCLEILDQDWKDSYVNNTFYLGGISFYERAEDVLPYTRKLTFNSENALVGAEKLSDFYIEKAQFDLNTGGVAGNLGYDAEVGAVYAQNAVPATNVECGTRVFFRAKQGVQPILGSAYPFIKIRFKTNVPLTENTYISIRDCATGWGYYGEVRNISGTTDWIEAVFDMRKGTTLDSVGDWTTAEIGGRADTFVVEICDDTWENVYPDGLKVYFDYIAFYADENDVEKPGKILSLNFNSQNTVKGSVSDTELSDFYVGKATFDLGLTNTDGAIGYDSGEGAVFAKASAKEALACGTRFFIYSKNGASINGSDYRYVKIRFKSEIPLNANTTVALRDFTTHWAYYGVAYNAVGSNEWSEVVIDLKASHTLSPVADWSQASIGVGDTFCLEFLDQGWKDSYVNNTFYLGGISFYERAEDVLPESREFDFDSENAVVGSENLSDLYFEKAQFDLRTGGILGNIGYDETVDAIYAENATEATKAECGTRMHFRFKNNVQPILGSAYPIVKIKFKTNVPLTDNTYIAIRDYGTAKWEYYGEVRYIGGTTDWVEAVFDMRKSSTISPAGDWSKYEIGGRANTFAVEICDDTWSDVYPNGLKIYIDSIGFYSEDNYSETDNTLSLKFNSANSVKGEVSDSQLSDYYLGKADFDIAYGGDTGIVGYDETEGAVFAKTSYNEQNACGTRMYIYAKDGVSSIKGGIYRYMKLRFKSSIPLTENTIISLRDMSTTWGFYSVCYTATGTDQWTEVVFDLMAEHTMSPKGDWETASIGKGDTFCVEVFDRSVSNSYKNNFVFYISDITFYENAQDVFPEERYFALGSEAAVKGNSSLSNLYLDKATFDIYTAGVLGNVGYNEANHAVYGENAVAAQYPECGGRFFFRAKQGAQPIFGSAYRYMTVRFKSSVPLTDNTYVALRDMVHHWGYYGVAKCVPGTTDWVEVTIDMKTPHDRTPVGNWNTAELGGRADTFALEFYDLTWENVYPDGLRIYFDSITLSFDDSPSSQTEKFSMSEYSEKFINDTLAGNIPSEAFTKAIDIDKTYYGDLMPSNLANLIPCISDTNNCSAIDNCSYENLKVAYIDNTGLLNINIVGATESNGKNRVMIKAVPTVASKNITEPTSVKGYFYTENSGHISVGIPFEFVLKNNNIIGDADDSGGIDVLDLIRIRNRILNKISNNSKMDYNGDGVINIVDLLSVKSHIIYNKNSEDVEKAFLKVGMSSVDITPTEDVYLEGYVSPGDEQGLARYPEDFTDSIMARVLIVDNGEGPLVFVNMEILINYLHLFSSEIKSNIAAVCGTTADKVFFSNTHNHQMNSSSFNETTEEKIMNAVKEAYSRMEPAVVKVDSVPSNLIVSRGTALGIDFDMTVDNMMTILRFDSENTNKPIGMIWNAPFHSTMLSNGYPENYNLLSPEFSGYASRYLENQMQSENNNFTAMCIIGFTGNSGPNINGNYNASTVAELKQAGDILGAECLRIYNGIENEVSGNEFYTMAGTGELPRSSDIRKKENYGTDLSVVTGSIGDVCYFGVNYEVFSVIGSRLKAEAPYSYIVNAGVSVGSNAYLPTKEVFDIPEYYETSPAATCFGPEAEEPFYDIAIRTICNNARVSMERVYSTANAVYDVSGVAVYGFDFEKETTLDKMVISFGQASRNDCASDYELILYNAQGQQVFSKSFNGYSINYVGTWVKDIEFTKAELRVTSKWQAGNFTQSGIFSLNPQVYGIKYTPTVDN